MPHILQNGGECTKRENYIETDVEEDELEDELDETITDNIEYPCSLCNTNMCSLERLIAHMQDHQKQRSSRRNRKMFPVKSVHLFSKQQENLSNTMKTTMMKTCPKNPM